MFFGSRHRFLIALLLTIRFAATQPTAGEVIALLLWRHHVREVGLATMAALFFAPGAAAKTGKVYGIIYTLGSDGVQTVWPNARITLKNLSSQSAVSTVSDDVGELCVHRGAARRVRSHRPSCRI